MKQDFRNSVALLALTGALALTANQALAGGFSIREQSSLGLSMAFAGAAAGYDNDLTAMFFNPATVTMHEGIQGQADVSLILPSSRAKDGVASGRPAAFTTPVAGSANSGNIGVRALVPSTYAAYSMSDKLYFGMSVNAPFGLSTKADSGWVGRYHGIESAIETINVNPVIGYKLTPKVSIAVGPMIQYIDVKLTSAVDVLTVCGLTGVCAGSAVDGFSKVKGNDIGFGFTAGVLWQPTPRTRIGIGFRSAVKHKLDGNVTTTSPDAGFNTNVGPALNTGIIGNLTLPETVSIGFRQQVTDKIALSAAAEWANWSRFKELRIQYDSGFADNVTNEKWKDSWFFSGGAEYKWSGNTTIRAGAGYESSPVPDSTRTPRLPDNDRVWLSGGLTHKVASWLTVTAGYTHIFVKEAPVNLTVVGDPSNASRGNLMAKFNNHIDIAAISVKIGL